MAKVTSIPKPRIEIPILLSLIATGIELEILNTPTGASREELTAANIQFLKMKKKLENALLGLGDD